MIRCNNNRLLRIKNSSIIGSGSFGLVRIVELNDGSIYVVKQNKKPDSDKFIPMDSLAEINYLKIFDQCSQIIKLDGVCQDSLTYLFLEKMSGDISKLPYEETKLINMINTVGEGLSLIHSTSLIHADIKLENILYNSITDEFKISDMGLAIPTFNFVWIGGTLEYLAPEMLMNKTLDPNILKSVDYWAFGMTIINYIIFNYLFNRRFQNTKDKMVDRIYDNYSERHTMTLLEFKARILNGTITGHLDFKKIIKDEVPLEYPKVIGISDIKVTLANLLMINPIHRKMIRLDRRFFDNILSTTNISNRYLRTYTHDYNIWLYLNNFNVSVMELIIMYEVCLRLKLTKAVDKRQMIIILSIVLKYMQNKKIRNEIYYLTNLSQDDFNIEAVDLLLELDHRLYNPYVILCSEPLNKIRYLAKFLMYNPENNDINDWFSTDIVKVNNNIRNVLRSNLIEYTVIIHVDRAKAIDYILHYKINDSRFSNLAIYIMDSMYKLDQSKDYIFVAASSIVVAVLFTNKSTYTVENSINDLNKYTGLIYNKIEMINYIGRNNMNVQYGAILFDMTRLYIYDQDVQQILRYLILICQYNENYLNNNTKYTLFETLESVSTKIKNRTTTLTIKEEDIINYTKYFKRTIYYNQVYHVGEKAVIDNTYSIIGV